MNEERYRESKADVISTNSHSHRSTGYFITPTAPRIIDKRLFENAKRTTTSSPVKTCQIDVSFYQHGLVFSPHALFSVGRIGRLPLRFLSGMFYTRDINIIKWKGKIYDRYLVQSLSF